MRALRTGLTSLSRALLIGACASALLAACASTAPGERQVTIKRDDYGVPHVYASDLRGLFHGFGYAVAEDRLYQLEMLKRSGNGSVAEVLGPDYVATDIATRSNLDPASVRAQLAALKPEDRAIFEGYAAGVNARIADVLAQRATLLPRQFIDNGFEPTRWTDEDVAYVWIGLILNRFFAGTAEIANFNLLGQLKAARGEEAGQRIYEQLRWLEDPTAPTIVPRTAGAAPVAARPAEPAVSANAALAPLSPQAAEDFKAVQVARMGPAVAEGLPTASNAWVLSPGKSASGDAVLYNGPQQGFNNPAFVHGIGLHGAGYDLTGITPIGLPAVLFGTNGTIAWGSTVGSLDTNDVYQETLNPANPREVLFNGSFRPMAQRTDILRVKGAPDRPVDIYSTVHGFVQSVDAANARAYTVKSSWQGREIETLLGWTQAAQATDWPQFLAQGARVSSSITWFYADVQGNIGAVGLGRVPRRPGAQDIRFPASGDGRMEWDGALPFDTNPRAYNPAQGYLASWNNQIAGGLRADGANFSHVDRAAELHVQLQAKPKFNADEVWKIGDNAALADLNARYFVPYIARATAQLPATDPLRKAADLLAGWDLKNRKAATEAAYDSPGTTLLRAWLTAMARRLLQDDLPPAVFASYANLGYPTVGPRGSPGSVQPAAVSKLLWNALRGAESGVPQRYDFFNGADRQAMVLAALSDAVAQLTAQSGPDMQGWKTPVVAHRFANVNAIGVPWAQPGEQPETAQYLNRGTTNFRVVLRRGAIDMCSVTAPGQSGFIDPAGVRDKHYGDQLQLFQNFGCKPERVTAAQVDAHRESVRTLRY